MSNFQFTLHIRAEILSAVSLPWKDTCLMGINFRCQMYCPHKTGSTLPTFSSESHSMWTPFITIHPFMNAPHFVNTRGPLVPHFRSLELSLILTCNDSVDQIFVTYWNRHSRIHTRTHIHTDRLLLWLFVVDVGNYRLNKFRRKS